MTAAVEPVESGARKRPRGQTRPAIVRAQRDEILRLIREEGAPPGTAAVVCGVPRRTHEDWLRRGRMENGPEPCRRYAADVEQAVEEWKLAHIGHIQSAAVKDARHAEWLLERRFPEFRERRHVDGAVKVQVTPLIDPSKGTVERLELLRDLLAEFAPDADDPALTETARPALELIEGEDFTEVA